MPTFNEIINTPGFSKLIKCYFGKETEYTFVETYMANYDEGPDHRLILIHVPHLNDMVANKLLVEFEDLLHNIPDFPNNCIIDVSYITHDEYLQTNVVREDTYADQAASQQYTD